MNKGDIILYQNDDGTAGLQVRFEGKDLWLTQNQVADLFNTTKQNISLHVQNIFETAELQADRTVKEYLTVRMEGKREVQRTLSHYNLDLIIAIGYRVNSKSATRFRQWATKVLVEYAVKGFAMDDARLKEPDNDYFDELLARIRDIRSSEKRFHRKVCDIFAESSDYDKSAPAAAEFFATVQNKLHWAAHGHTAAEVVYKRADAEKKDMGLTNYPKANIRKQDVSVGKNYLNEDELTRLNSLVTQFFEFAEGQAKQRKLVTMKGWIAKLNGLLTLNEAEVLMGSGRVSKIQAEAHAHQEYEKYKSSLQVPDAWDELEGEAKKLRS
jgi:hypothetical protein